MVTHLNRELGLWMLPQTKNTSTSLLSHTQNTLHHASSSTGHADYYGVLANTAARVAALASPGQILVEAASFPLPIPSSHGQLPLQLRDDAPVYLVAPWAATGPLTSHDNTHRLPPRMTSAASSRANSRTVTAAAAAAAAARLQPPQPAARAAAPSGGARDRDEFQDLGSLPERRIQNQNPRLRDGEVPSETTRVPSILSGSVDPLPHFSKFSNVSVFSSSPAGSYSQSSLQLPLQLVLPTPAAGPSLRRGLFGPLTSAWARATAGKGAAAAAAASQAGLAGATIVVIGADESPAAAAAAAAVKRGRVTLGWVGVGGGPSRMAQDVGPGPGGPPEAAAAVTRGEGSSAALKDLTVQLGWQRDSRGEEQEEQCKASIQR